MSDKRCEGCVDQARRDHEARRERERRNREILRAIMDEMRSLSTAEYERAKAKVLDDGP